MDKKVLVISGSPRKGGNYGSGVYQKGEVKATKAMNEACTLGTKA